MNGVGEYFKNGGGLAPMDRQLLDVGSARKMSGKELSAAIDGLLPPEKALKRFKDLLASQDVYSQDEQKKMWRHTIDGVVEMLNARMKAGNLDETGNLLKALDMVRKAIESDKIDTEKAMQQIRAAHAQLFVQAITIAVEKMALGLREAHPEITAGEMQEILADAMPGAFEYVNARAVGQ